MERLVRGPYVECRVRCQVRQVRRGKHFISPKKVWELNVRQQVSRDSRQSPSVALRHLYLVRCVDRRLVEVNRNVATVFPEGFPGILCPTVSANALDPNPEGLHHLPYVKLNDVDGWLRP